MSTHLQPVTDSSFDTDVLQSTTPVVVDFWAEWCNPCKMIAPLLEEAAVTYAGKIKIVKLNVDENNTTAAKFGIRGIPTLLVFKNGKVAATKVGHLTKSQLSEFLDSHLG
ncbi:MAG TPA: thioredoxin TrxA [Gammaproteobacteria bacterium]|nr:thioredoxin TrxA [Gammaproteobacteria bacterium]HQY22230.1 thioredoxin TrxA [Gammaproteobacteria bacterium]HQZ87241.1 thioredoxin TrxA [Gammaproteobacteria bacterium]HRA42652.1 thioredoxin TrxA [Gammaproteobacteria bacterium]